MPTISTRKATEADLEALQRLWRQADELHAEIRPDFFRVPDGPQPSLRQLRELLGGWERTVLVAEHQQALVGLVQVGVFDTPTGAGKVQRRRGRVDDIVVDAEHRRRGVGRALMAAAEHWCRQRGAAQLVLTVWTGNRNADAFYEALGYASISMVLGREL
jgi:ribosomal protein S18 acetylase RimI-like enzyme